MQYTVSFLHRDEHKRVLENDYKQFKTNNYYLLNWEEESFWYEIAIVSLIA